MPHDDASPFEFSPTVLSPLTGPGLLNYVLSTQTASTPTTLLICSSRADFLNSLLHNLQEPEKRPQEAADAQRLEQLLIPTLHHLFTAQYVKVAFCASLQALLAYLSAYEGNTMGHGVEKLILANPIALHASTSSYSAQGLSRTFAAAVDTAFRLRAKLVLVECLGMHTTGPIGDDEEAIDIVMRDGDEDDQGFSDGAHRSTVDEDPWEEEVPILNVSARRFGNGERSWAGRKMKIRTIAARWCQFEELAHQVQEEESHKDNARAKRF